MYIFDNIQVIALLFHVYTFFFFLFRAIQSFSEGVVFHACKDLQICKFPLCLSWLEYSLSDIYTISFPFPKINLQALLFLEIIIHCQHLGTLFSQRRYPRVFISLENYTGELHPTGRKLCYRKKQCTVTMSYRSTVISTCLQMQAQCCLKLSQDTNVHFKYNHGLLSIRYTTIDS